MIRGQLKTLASLTLKKFVTDRLDMRLYLRKDTDRFRIERRGGGGFPSA